MLITVEKVLLLENTVLFAGLPGPFLAEIAADFTETIVKSGYPIIQQGEFCESMFIVAKGAVRLIIDQHQNRIISEGHSFATLTAITPSIYPISAIAEADVTFLEIGHDLFNELMLTHTELAQAVIRFLTEICRQTLGKNAFAQ